MVQQSSSAYATFVNPQWRRLLAVLGMHVSYERCAVIGEAHCAGGFWSEALGLAERALQS
jgi:hypothetical protein